MFKIALATLAFCAAPFAAVSPAGTAVPDAPEIEFDIVVSEDGLFLVNPPPAPTGLDAFRISNTPGADPICIVWSYSGGAVDGFRVARLDPGENPSNAAHWDNISGNLGSGARSFLDCTAVCPGLTYRYKVRAFRNSSAGQVYSGYSNIDNAIP